MTRGGLGRVDFSFLRLTIMATLLSFSAAGILSPLDFSRNSFLLSRYSCIVSLWYSGLTMCGSLLLFSASFFFIISSMNTSSSWRTRLESSGLITPPPLVALPYLWRRIYSPFCLTQCIPLLPFSNIGVLSGLHESASR